MIGKRVGKHVKLNEFDSFKLCVKSDGSETLEASTTYNITKVASHFHPGKEFKKAIENS